VKKIERLACILVNAADVEPQLVHIASEFIAQFDRDWGDSLLGDIAHSVLFDNSKIKRLVPNDRTFTPFARHAGDRRLV